MPYSRKRRIIKKKPAVRRYRKRVTKVVGLVKPKMSRLMHNFKRTVYSIPNASTDATLGVYLRTMTFKISDLPNVGEFEALYDYYKITRVVVRVIWRATNISVMETNNLASKVGAPYMYYVVDRDTTLPPTDVDEIREYSRAKQFTFMPDKRVCRISFKPSILQDAALTTGGNVGIVTYNRWLDLAGPDVVYLGLRLAIFTPHQSAPIPSNFFDIETTYYFSMKDPR